ncbi:MAG: 16S rRNA (adenine(1518)-N(6)/adenine(1519)-N(6))-dimethyltransferase RsmA [Ilumatobacteraceae bacterium]
MTHSRPAIRELLDTAALAPRRDLGQNFVADPNTVRRIAAIARVGPGDRVVEIGAGLGSLTLALADTGADVTAIEVDHGVVPILRHVVAERTNVTVVEADAMTLDWPALLTGPAGDAGSTGAGAVTSSNDHPPWVLVANLPYNVATPLICDLLDEVPEIHRMLVMVQREAAERFAARPRTSAYGAVSVKAAFWGAAKIVGHVPASVFVPRPNVESALVEITRHQPPPTDPGALFGLVRTAFGQRRKMLRRSLAGIVEPETFEAAGISPTARPEELDVDAWCRLTDAHLAAGRSSPDPAIDDGPTGSDVPR